MSTSSCACRCASSLESSPRLDISSIADTTCCSRPSIVAAVSARAGTAPKGAVADVCKK